jgi:enamine deaminase RidA (YjgF/YER057c/UK114 family)
MVTLNKQGILMNDIVRIETNQRMSRVVKAAGLVFVGGQTSNDRTLDVKGQTPQVWLADIGRDFAGMNEVWDAWVAPGCAPTRATVESKLAAPDLLVEITVTALA